jgi:hypothetical protein
VQFLAGSATHLKRKKCPVLSGKSDIFGAFYLYVKVLEQAGGNCHVGWPVIFGIKLAFGSHFLINDTAEYGTPGIFKTFDFHTRPAKGGRRGQYSVVG